MFKIGADPEFFVYNTVTKEIRSVGTRLGCSKSEPLRIEGPGGTYLISEDNVAVEVAIPPAATPELFWDYISHAKDLATKIVQDLMGPEHAIIEGASHEFSQEELDATDAWTFGCDPDFCVYKLEFRTPPGLDVLERMGLKFTRSVGGHLHIDTPQGDFDKVVLGRVLDYLIGREFATIDTALPRRVLYGRAGAIRFKDYGVEYRTPGNFWAFSEQHSKRIFSLANQAVEAVRDNNKSLLKKVRESTKETRFMIDNVKEMRKLFAQVA